MKERLRWGGKRALGFAATLWRRRAAFPYCGSEPRTIAVFAGGGIGDVLMAFPAVLFLERLCPGATITLFTRPPAHDLARLVYERFEVRCMSAAGAVTRLGRFDIGVATVVAAYSPLVEWLGLFTCRRTFGFCYPDESPAYRGYDATSTLAADEHDIDQNLRLVSRLFAAPVREEDRTYPLREPKGKQSGPVVVHPGAHRGYPAKRWAPARYGEIIRRLVEGGRDVCIVLGPGERDDASLYTSIEGARLLVAPSAAGLVRTVEGASLFVGNDSGVAHLAAFLGVATVTLFGPTDPCRTAPRGPLSRVVCTDVACAPCHFRNGVTGDCADAGCMLSLDVEKVWKAIRSVETLHASNPEEPGNETDGQVV